MDMETIFFGAIFLIFFSIGIFVFKQIDKHLFKSFFNNLFDNLFNSEAERILKNSEKHFIERFEKNVKSKHEEINSYVPGEGFIFFRKTSEDKIIHYKFQKKIIILIIPAIIILCFIFPDFKLRLIQFGVGIFIFLFSFTEMLINRIKLHEKIDEPTLFELEDLGLVKENDIVLSLYKDFESFENIENGSKILVLTPDKLNCLKFTDRNSAEIFKFRLIQVDKLIINQSGEALQLSLVLKPNNEIIFIHLKGNSVQDSPEEFISVFLKELDRALLESKNRLVELYEESISDSTTKKSKRLIEVIDITREISVENNSGTKNIDGNIRQIDF